MTTLVLTFTTNQGGALEYCLSCSVFFNCYPDKAEKAKRQLVVTLNPGVVLSSYSHPFSKSYDVLPNYS